MAHYYHKIKKIYEPQSVVDTDFNLRDDGSGVQIGYWNTGKLGVQPTIASLDAQIGDVELEVKMMWEKIRKERNQLLKDSDYTMLKDYPTTVSEQEWTTYRQSLRDIPQTFSNPDDVTYPDKPE